MIFHTLGYADGSLCKDAPVATHFRDLAGLIAQAPAWVAKHDRYCVHMLIDEPKTVHIVKVSTQVQGHSIQGTD